MNAKSFFFSLLIALPLLMSACSSMPEKVQQVSPGMTSAQVLKAMGEPQDRTFRGKREHWSYDTGDGDKVKIIVFENAQVVDLLNSDKKSQAMHELGKADPLKDDPDRCVGSNKYGKYGDGGGCNMYGCWPKGGYCNGFGCSTTGVCTVNGCPKKITSYACKE